MFLLCSAVVFGLLSNFEENNKLIHVHYADVSNCKNTEDVFSGELDIAITTEQDIGKDHFFNQFLIDAECEWGQKYVQATAHYGFYYRALHCNATKVTPK